MLLPSPSVGLGVPVPAPRRRVNPEDILEGGVLEEREREKVVYGSRNSRAGG